MGDFKKKIKKFQLAVVFAFVVFLIFLVTLFIVFTGIFILEKLGLSVIEENNKMPLFTLALMSLVIGTIFAFLFSKRPLKPIRTLGEAADRIASGDYSTRVELKGPDEIVQLGQQFNHMAEELGSVEMLRSDFVNNFSHEFKTPIVSIRGFARMLKWDNLTEEERTEYLDTIITESERLAELAANTLNLTKLERQTLLTNQKTFNLSEQIRLVIAMMYSKWESKAATFYFDCGEHFITGNEELLKQVWINLLDNATKFSPEHSLIQVELEEKNSSFLIRIKDNGIGMNEETAARVFDKFYQGDTSHTTSGNGLGLSIARRIVELHGGTICVKSKENAETTFEVGLPQTNILL